MGITLLLALEMFSAIKFDLMKISFLGPAKPIIWRWYDFTSYMNNDKQHESIYTKMTTWLYYIMRSFVLRAIYTLSTKWTDSISVKE